MKETVLLLGAGGIGSAIARRVSYGRSLIVADIRKENAERTSEELRNCGFDAHPFCCDLGDKESIRRFVRFGQEKGPIRYLIASAGVSPSQASIEEILRVDLYGTAVLLEEVGKVIEEGGSAVVISSQSGHRLKALGVEADHLLAATDCDSLLELPMLQSISNTLEAYQYAKRANVLRVAFEAERYGKRGATINAISPGIILTKLANDELSGPRGDNYRRMIESCPAKRAGTTDEVGELAAFLLSDKARFISGADFLIDGGTTASYWYGSLSDMRKEMGD